MDKNLKERFIGDFAYSRSTLDAAELYEEVLQKDCYKWSYSEITSFLCQMNASSFHSLRKYVSILRQYTQFAIEQGVDATLNPYNNFSREDISKCVSKNYDCYLTRTDVLELCETLMNKRDEFLFLAVYEGLNLQDLLELKLTDVNREEKTIWSASRNRTFTFSDELINLAFAADAEDGREFTNGSVRKFHDGREGYLFRVLTPNGADLRQIRDRFIHAMEKGSLSNRKIGYKQLELSGFVYDLDNNSQGLSWKEFIDKGDPKEYNEVLLRHGRSNYEKMTVRVTVRNFIGGPNDEQITAEIRR